MSFISFIISQAKSSFSILIKIKLFFFFFGAVLTPLGKSTEVKRQGPPQAEGAALRYEKAAHSDN